MRTLDVAVAEALGCTNGRDRARSRHAAILIDPPIPMHLRGAYDSPVAKVLAKHKPVDGPAHPALADEGIFDKGGQ